MSNFWGSLQKRTFRLFFFQICASCGEPPRRKSALGAAQRKSGHDVLLEYRKEDNRRNDREGHGDHLLVDAVVRAHAIELDHDGKEILVGQREIGPEEIRPDAVERKERDHHYDRLAQRHDDAEKDHQIRAAVYARRLDIFL